MLLVAGFFLGAAGVGVFAEIGRSKFGLVLGSLRGTVGVGVGVGVALGRRRDGDVAHAAEISFSFSSLLRRTGTGLKVSKQA